MYAIAIHRTDVKLVILFNQLFKLILHKAAAGIILTK